MYCHLLSLGSVGSLQLVSVLLLPCRQLDQQVQELAQPSKQFPRIVFKTVYARRRYYQYTVGAIWV